jgi:hypothetical protein
MGEQHGNVVRDLEAVLLDLFEEGLRYPHRLHSEGRLNGLVAGNIRFSITVKQHEGLADAKFMVGDDGAVYLDTV